MSSFYDGVIGHDTNLRYGDSAMKVEKTHRVDAGEKDAQGYYDYYYEYDDYLFSNPSQTVFARSYSDSPKEVSFRTITEGNRQRAIERADMDLPMLKEAVDYLRSEGKREFQLLTELGYAAIDI